MSPIFDLLFPPNAAGYSNLGIVVAIAICFPVSLLRPRLRPVASVASTILGILGTFVGIFIGLLGFNVNDIQGSVPILLDGLKTAFFTSIAGMTCSLAIRFIDSLPLFRARKRDAPKGATIQTLADLMLEQNSTAKELSEKQLKSLEGIRLSVSGEGETSMLTQVQKFRTSVADKQDELIGEFRSFAQTMADNNSKALIEALNEVIRDFNAKINEQFGENFKQLNEAVGKMVLWQENYAQQTAQMIEQFKITVAGIESAKNSLAQIAARSQVIQESAQKLTPILEGVERQRQDMERYLSQFAEISKNARELLPILEKKIMELTEDFAEAVHKASEMNARELEKQQAHSQSLIRNFEALDQKAKENIEKVMDATHRVVDQMNAGISHAATQQLQLVSDLNNRLNSNMTEIFRKTEENLLRLAGQSRTQIEEQLKAIDRGLEEELRKTFEAFGQRLAAISDRFARDYTPLAERLREVVAIAERVRDGGRT